MNQNDEFDFSSIVDKNYERARQKEDEIRKNAVKNSVGYNEKKYNQRKKKNKGVVIATIAIIVSIAIGKYVANNVSLISTSIESKRAVNNAIKNYEATLVTDDYTHMNNGFEIEFTHGRDYVSGEVNVSYSHENFANDIVNASKISASRVRELMLAAYNVINEGSKEQVFNDTLKYIATHDELIEQIPDGYSFLKSGNLEEFLNALGYSDFEDYAKNERKNINLLYAVEEAISSGKVR